MNRHIYTDEFPKCPKCGSDTIYDGDTVFMCSSSKCGYVFECDDEFEYETIDEEYYSDDYIPEGCEACGGPYPQCTISCKLFDD